MKSKLLGIALLFPMVAFADNTVTFLGEVSSSTCNVTVNGASGNISVLLPTTTITALQTAGATAGETPFNFVVSGCEASADGDDSNVAMRLVPLSTTTSGTLTNVASTSTAAAGVAIQIVDGTTAIDFSDGDYSSTSQKVASGTTGTLTFPFTARYYSLATTAVPVTSGKVESQLQYALTYN